MVTTLGPSIQERVGMAKGCIELRARRRKRLGRTTQCARRIAPKARGSATLKDFRAQCVRRWLSHRSRNTTFTRDRLFQMSNNMAPSQPQSLIMDCRHGFLRGGDAPLRRIGMHRNYMIAQRDVRSPGKGWCAGPSGARRLAPRQAGLSGDPPPRFWRDRERPSWTDLVSQAILAQARTAAASTIRSKVDR